jgi:transposase-like protein
MAKSLDLEVDDDEKPPPCPWCHAAKIVELTHASDDVRMFICASCARTFLIHCEFLNPPE